MSNTKYPVGLLQSSECLGERDAVHMPVQVVFCKSRVFAGNAIRFISRNEVVVDFDGPHHGFVDPFIKSVILPNYPFLVFVRPDLTTPPRHEFKTTIPEAERTEVPEVKKDDDEDFDECKWCN